MGISTSTPNATTTSPGSVQLAGQLGGTATSPTVTALTGKAVAVANIADGTDGNLITWDSSGVAAVVATGDADQVLTSNGAGAAPTFQDAAGGSGQTLYDAIVAASGGDYTTLGAAITGGATTIFIREGTYVESAITSSVANLTIVGANPETTILAFATADFTLSGTRLRLQNLKMTFSTGDLKSSGTYSEIIGCHYSKTGNTGAGYVAGDDSLVQDCTFLSTSTLNNVQMDINAARLRVIGNQFKHTASCTLTNSGIGTYRFGGSGTLVTANAFQWSTSGTGTLVGVSGTVTGNTFIIDDTAIGVRVGGGTFSGNAVTDGLVGIVAGSSQPIITGNTITSQADAIQVNGAQTAVSGNYFFGAGTTAGFTAIDVLTSIDEVSIQNNYIANYAVGINVTDSACDRTTIISNTIDNNVTTPIVDAGTNTYMQSNFGASALQEAKLLRMKNTSGGQLVAGDVVVIKAVAAGDEFTTTTTQGDDKVLGMVAATIADTAYGLVQVSGKTVSLKVNGTTDIAIGDYLGTHTDAGIAMKASAGDMCFAMALEAYTANDSSGVIDALLISPRLI